MAESIYSKRNSTPPLLSGDRPLPHNKEAEVAVLGAMLLDPANAIDVAVSRLSADNSFYVPAHQTIFTCLARLGNEKPRGSVDLITLADALESEGRLEEVGGRAVLIRLINSVPTAANIEHYVDIVHQNAVLRRLIVTGLSIVDRCFDPGEDVNGLLDEIEQQVMSVSGDQSGGHSVVVGDKIVAAIEYIDRLRSQDKSALGVSTGYPDLDNMLTGMMPGDMIVLAARPSIGKTAFALNLVENISIGKDPTPVGVFSLEMGTDQLVLRLLCSQARVNLGDIREGALSAGRWQNIMDAGQRLREAPIYIDDSGGLDIVELRARARRMKRDHDIGLLVIDYLQLLKGSSQNKNATRENEVAQMSGGIKSLAKELSIPIIVLAQLNRQAEQPGARPKLAHLRESGAIEQDADVVAMLHRERETDKASPTGSEGMEAELIVAKHRNGPTGVVPLTFLPHFTRFESRSMISDEDVPRV